MREQINTELTPKQVERLKKEITTNEQIIKLEQYNDSGFDIDVIIENNEKLKIKYKKYLNND